MNTRSTSRTTRALARRFRLGQGRRADDRGDQGILMGLKNRDSRRLFRHHLRRSDQHGSRDVAEVHPQSPPSGQAIGWLDTASVKVEINEPESLVVLPEHIIDVNHRRNPAFQGLIYREHFRSLLSAMEKDLRVVSSSDRGVRAVAERLRLNKGPAQGEIITLPTECCSSSDRRVLARPSLQRPSPNSCSVTIKRWFASTCPEYGDGTIGIEKLIGMPRGIVGSERGGILTEQLRDNPYTVLLLDEVEKASPYLMNIFLRPLTRAGSRTAEAKGLSLRRDRYHDVESR